ncbi:hypothetical protein RJ640_027059 [Escallonia rubra]|uniref:Disease resistance protein RPM1-like n=1 Tax=Escallonia rubra TaxID=112253 RepID=A0AA88QMW0_9ASTE|nr:hypothetical protein RJ640_027059 [Escallonia rubra]
MAEIAVSFLLNKLAVFLHDEKSLLGGVREEAEYIRAKLEQMRAFLSVADAKEESDPRLQVWIKQVRDVACDTEDILDELILRLANNHRGFFGSLYRITWYVKKIKAHHQIASKIQRIRPRIDNIFQNYGGFDHGSSSTVINNAWLDRRGDALLIEEAELVGIEQPKRQLISWLVNNDSGLKVVSVAGMGGSGKTTLLSLDLIEEWLSKNLSNSTLGGGLSISGIATYQPFDGLMELKMIHNEGLTGYVSFLLNKLAVLLHDEKSLLGGVREEAEYIRAKLEQMRAFLSVADAKEESDPRLQVWIKQVRDVACDTEDILDEFILRLTNNHRDGLFWSLHRITWYVKKIKARHQIASKIHRIRQRIDNIFQNYGGFDHASSSTVVNNAWLDRRGDALLIEEAELVGIEQQKRQLISWLVNDDSGLKVVSVAGMGGSGKTTLSFKIEELLKHVIQQLFDELKQPVPQAVETMASHSLKELIREFLQQSRYVLVLDDVWSLDAWIAMEIALPNNNRGSRVVLTTRNLSIASACCLKTRGKTYTMKALSPEESWTLFCRKVFQGTDCPQPLYPLSKCILEKCEGLPLAIVAMGGFLATKDRRVEEWAMVRRSLGDELESNDQFREDEADTVVECRRICASARREDFRDVAENYLNNLVNRSLVQVARRTRDGRLRTCRVHDLLREMILSKSRELSIGTIISGHDANRLLKVLDLGGAPLEKIPSVVFTLIHLRYLSMRGTNVRLVPKTIRKLRNLETLDLKDTYVKALPTEILRLHKLRHVLLYGYEFIDNIGIHMARGFRAPYTIGDLISLQKLCYIEAGEINGSGGSCNIVTEIGKLTQLRRLGITKLRSKDGMDFCSSIEKLTNLRSLYVYSVAEDEILDLQSLSSAPQFLRRLELGGRLENLPQWIPSLYSLVSLFLCYSQLRDDTLQSLEALPNLELLSFFQAYEGKSLTFKAGGFQRLKELNLFQLKGLRSLTVEDGAMPHLEEIHFQGCKLVDELPSGIQHLTNMQLLRLVDMPDKLTMPLQGQGGIFSEASFKFL